MSEPPPVMAAKTYAEGATAPATRKLASGVPASASAKAAAASAGFPDNKWVPVSATAAKKPSSSPPRPATPVAAAAAAKGTPPTGKTGRQPRRAPAGKRLIRPDVPRQLPPSATSGLTARVGIGRSVSQGHIDAPEPDEAALLKTQTFPAEALPTVGGRGEGSRRLQRVRNRLSSSGATGDASLSASAAAAAATVAEHGLSRRGAEGTARTGRRSTDDDAVGRKSEDFRHAVSRRQLAAAVKAPTADTGKDGAASGQQSGRGPFHARRLKRNGSSAVPGATGATEDVRRSGSTGSSSNGGSGGNPVGHTSGDCVVARSAVPYSSVFPVQEQQVGPKHFEKMRLLGQGSIGKVFLVRLRGTDRYYAMKELTKRDMIERNKIKRVMTEREILVTAHHPFIVTMYASFQTHNTLSFVMEHCQGGEFFRVLQKQPNHRLKESSARFYAAEVLLALEYLHHIGFIYRDLVSAEAGRCGCFDRCRTGGDCCLLRSCRVERACRGGPWPRSEAISFSHKWLVLFSVYLFHGCSASFAFACSCPLPCHVVESQKPENVLMRANGHIALTDFDLSKEATPVSPRIVSQHRSLMKRISCRLPGSLSPSGSRTGGGQSLLDMVESEPELKTSSTSFVGTAEYLSPEIIKGETQTSAVDWWTLGVLIYEVCEGGKERRREALKEHYPRGAYGGLLGTRAGIFGDLGGRTLLDQLYARKRTCVSPSCRCSCIFCAIICGLVVLMSDNHTHHLYFLFSSCTLVVLLFKPLFSSALSSDGVRPYALLLPRG